MTAVCGGGTSGPKTGVAAIVDYTSGLLAAIFGAYDLKWLIPIIPLVGLAPLTLSTFCSSDPPATPTFTAAETDALLQLKFGPDFDSGLAKMKDLILHIIWYDACQCNTGSLTPFVAPTPPSGTPITQFPRNPSDTPCVTYTHTNTFTWTGTQNFNLGVPTHNPIVPSAYLVHCVNNIVSGGGVPLQFVLEQYNPIESSILRSKSLVVNPGTSADLIDGSVSTFDSIHVRAQATGGVGVSNAVGTRVDWYCDGQAPGGTQTPCCPPDAATQSYLDHILTLVTLIQRQTSPFAYVLGTNHAGLSGNGELTINGLLGAKVNPASIPSWSGVEVGDPDSLWLDSWIRWGNPDGWTQREFLTSAPYVSLPQLAGQFTKLGYTLRPGITVDITELVREP